MNPKELLQNWIDAFQRRDLEAVVACYAETAVNFQIAAGEPSVGKEQIRHDTAEFFRAFPDAWSKVKNIISDENWAAWEWIGGGGSFHGRILRRQTDRKIVRDSRLRFLSI